MLFVNFFYPISIKNVLTKLLGTFGKKKNRFDQATLIRNRILLFIYFHNQQEEIVLFGEIWRERFALVIITTKIEGILMAVQFR